MEEIVEVDEKPLVRDKVARRRIYGAALILYIAVIVVIFATFIGYPEFFYDSSYRYELIRKNYQIIVISASAFAGIVTASIVSPRILAAISEVILPTRALKDAAVSIVESVSGLVLAPQKRETAEVDKVSFSPPGRAGKESERVFRKPEYVTADVIVTNFVVRMREEQKRLKGNALSNLIWGVMFATLGLAVLSYPVLFPVDNVSPNWVEFLVSYSPRAMLALMISIISFFFLRLYASNEYDLKHTKNEISTFESKVIAAKLAIEAENDAALIAVVNGLSNNERNFILKSGEKTISNEVDTSHNEMSALLRDVLLSRHALEGRS